MKCCLAAMLTMPPRRLTCVNAAGRRYTKASIACEIQGFQSCSCSYGATSKVAVFWTAQNDSHAVAAWGRLGRGENWEWELGLGWWGRRI